MDISRTTQTSSVVEKEDLASWGRQQKLNGCFSSAFTDGVSSRGPT